MLPKFPVRIAPTNWDAGACSCLFWIRSEKQFLKSGMKIEKPAYQAAYAYARQVYAGTMRLTEAKERLSEIGVNPNSAADFIYILKHMLSGEIYKRAMSTGATEDFIQWIRRDYGENAFRNALSALRLHIPYNGGAMLGHKALLAKFELEPAVTFAEAGTALEDLVQHPIGNELPDRAKRTSYVFQRDPKVRAHVLKRAAGRCEYCGREGFLLPNGLRYVEAHHIIGLAASGPDTVQNVIGLCAEHHREAHYGLNADVLEAKCIERLAILAKSE